jgi:outer membrane protein
MSYRLLILTAALLVGAPISASAQTPAPPPHRLTLDAAIQYALDHYPAVRAALEQVAATSTGLTSARAASLPRLDAMWQSNRATANNVFGQVLPQGVLPSLSGPVLASAASDSVWSSAVGALVTWEPLDFGLRSAGVAIAEAAVTRARAGEALTRLDVETAAADAFLGVVAAERTLAAATADRDRRDAIARSVHALVDNQLRAGADASRADAERAAADTRVIRAEQNVDLAENTLARVLGIATDKVTINAGLLLENLPPVSGTTTAAASVHPFVQAQQGAVDVAKATQEILAKSDRPRLLVQTSVFARGSGASTTGAFDGGIGGLGLDRTNWAAGLQIVFPNVFDLSSLHARQAGAAASERVEQAHYDEALLTVTRQQQAASITLSAARAIAANTPVQLSAARQSETQAKARYDAGLATLVELADAENLLAQAEAQDSVARVEVWRAFLGDAVARGDVLSILPLIRSLTGGR